MNHIKYLSLVAFLFLFHSCTQVEKDVHNYYPKVKTDSLIVHPDGSVTVYGEITSTGSTAITYCGICMDTAPNPDMISNQKTADTLWGNVFSCTYSHFDALQKYYFRAFTTNENGYAIGTDISAQGITFDSSIIPCHPAYGHFVFSGFANINDAITHMDASPPTTGGYDLHVYSGSHALGLSFKEFPTAGIYAVTSADYPGLTSVTLSMDGIKTDSAGTVYVQQITPTTIDITICPIKVYAHYGITGNTYQFTFTTRFRAGR